MTNVVATTYYAVILSEAKDDDTELLGSSSEVKLFAAVTLMMDARLLKHCLRMTFFEKRDRFFK